MATNKTYSVKDKDLSTHEEFIKLVGEKPFTTRSEVIMELITKYVKASKRKQND